jgi:hypothetical protein
VNGEKRGGVDGVGSTDQVECETVVLANVRVSLVGVVVQDRQGSLYAEENRNKLQYRLSTKCRRVSSVTTSNAEERGSVRLD